VDANAIGPVFAIHEDQDECAAEDPSRATGRGVTRAGTGVPGDRAAYTAVLANDRPGNGVMTGACA
jgi:hypothetical protein